MCGIAAFVGLGDGRDLTSMMDALRHRGPDGEGAFVDTSTGVHLGHRRLAIIDVAGGAQPMWNEDHTVAVIYNGEIYNHQELRELLVRNGHVFRSDHSDTEVLVHGYEEWGVDLPRHLNGMFAFALLDRFRRRLFLARDRFGEKPLYYLHKGRFFALASELHALYAHRAFTPQIRQESVQKFLAYGFLPSPSTLLEGVSKLPAGCHLTYDLETNTAHAAHYWEFNLEPARELARADEIELAGELRRLLFQAVRRRLIADVPVGLFLSGGLDSSSILAGAAAAIPREQIRTFTIGFTEPSFDESRFAEQVAKENGTHHAVDRLDLDTAHQLIPDVLSRLDEPVADPSIVPTYLLSRFTRRHVTVALSGDGGDELFAGYDPFRALRLARVYRAVVPPPIHAGLRRLATRLPISDGNMSLDFKLRRSLTGLSYPPAMWNPVWLSPLDPTMMRRFFERPLHAADLYSEAVAQWETGSSHTLIDRTLEFYTRFYLQENILTKVDRATMMCSLESRAVFLDNDLVEFCRRLPARFKYRRGDRKYLLKRAMQGVVPESVLARPKKGFGIPLAKWLRLLPVDRAPEPVPGIRLDEVARAWQEHREGRVDHRLFLWSWLSLQACVRKYASHRTPIG